MIANFTKGSNCLSKSRMKGHWIRLSPCELSLTLNYYMKGRAHCKTLAWARKKMKVFAIHCARFIWSVQRNICKYVHTQIFFWNKNWCLKYRNLFVLFVLFIRKPMQSKATLPTVGIVVIFRTQSKLLPLKSLSYWSTYSVFWWKKYKDALGISI